MINQIRLQNFRKHLDRTFDFTPGINAIRGEVENGKTTILEGFSYLVFGARALKESLDDVVTYGTPVSKLRVDGVITHLGVIYTAYRAKSGAEVTFGSERVTGQTEVTKFFERLFGADAEMAGKLMISSQKAIAASITAGPTDAGKMIEALADFDMIEDIERLVQTKLVTGVTTSVEARILQLEGQVAEVVVEDLAPLRNAVIDAEAEKVSAEIDMAYLTEKRSNLLVDLAKSILADEAALQRTIETTALELSQIDAALAVAAPIAPPPADLSAARAAVEAEKSYAKAAALHGELVKAAIGVEWDKDLESLEREAEETQAKSTMAEAKRQVAADEIGRIDKTLGEKRREVAVDIATLEGRLIKETTCAFCTKDLTDVPEVVQRNSQVGQDLELARQGAAAGEQRMGAERAAAVTLRDRYAAERKEADDYLADLRAVIARNDKVELLYAKAADFITVDRTTVPGLWTWTGPVISANRPDVAGALRALEARQTAAVQFEATRAAQQAQRNALKVKQDGAVLSRQTLQVKDAKETIAEAAELDLKLGAAREELALAQQELRMAQGTLATKVALQEQAARAAAQVKLQLKAAQAELVELGSNNALLKKLRAARPVITSKLWSIVLASSTGYFSQVRGEPSSISRDEKMFRVNGHPAAGLSGSAEDMLGLSVRIALTKTFLSGLGFLILDEPGAACSDSRESAMLGMLSTLGFEQILLVTHSDLCDAYADNMIIV